MCRFDYIVDPSRNQLRNTFKLLLFFYFIDVFFNFNTGVTWYGRYWLLFEDKEMVWSQHSYTEWCTMFDGNSNLGPINKIIKGTEVTDGTTKRLKGQITKTAL